MACHMGLVAQGLAPHPSPSTTETGPSIAPPFAAFMSLEQELSLLTSLPCLPSAQPDSSAGPRIAPPSPLTPVTQEPPIFPTAIQVCMLCTTRILFLTIF